MPLDYHHFHINTNGENCNTRTAVIYARYSSDNQREESIDAQLRICRRYCKEHNYTVLREYVDEAFTATNDNRPAYQQMFRDAKKGTFQVAVFHKVNRNARNEYDYYFHKMQLRRYGVSIEYAGQAFDTQTPEGQLMENQLVGMAAYFSRNLSKEVKKGQHENAVKCIHNGGTPPLGYDVVDHHYVINEAEASAVRFIFSAYVADQKYSDIIAECERRGYKTKRGSSFGKNSIHDILVNPKYAGFYIYGRTQGSRNEPRNSHRYNPNAFIVPNGMPAIITMDIWNKAQDRTKERLRPRGSYVAKEHFLLSGLVYCGICGSRMQGTSYKKNRKRYEYYRCKPCKNTIRKYDIEACAIGLVRKTITSKRHIRQLVASINDAIERNSSSHHSEYTALQKELSSIERANSNLLNMIEEGIISDIIKDRLRHNADRSKSIRRRLVELESETTQKLDASQIQEILSSWKSAKNPEELRAMLHTFVSKITLYADRIEIKMKITIDGKDYPFEPKKKDR